MPAPQAQKQPQASDPLHHPTAPGPRTKIPLEAIPVHSREGRVLVIAQSHRDPSENLVPEPQGQGKEAQRSRDRETEDGHTSSATVLRVWHDSGRGVPLSAWDAGPLHCQATAWAPHGTLPYVFLAVDSVPTVTISLVHSSW